jgi:hypothetical protein
MILVRGTIRLPKEQDEFWNFAAADHRHASDRPPVAGQNALGKGGVTGKPRNNKVTAQREKRMP